MYLIGYDIGSATIKAALIDANSQKVLGLVQYPDQEMDIISRQVGWAEQEPEMWWKNLCTATQKLIAHTKVNPQDIQGIGIAYQMHGLVLVDKNQQVLRSSIIWCDSRAAPIGRQAFDELGNKYCLSNFLNSPGNFTASKLKWIKDNEPEVYDKIYKILLPGDYIAMKLTGDLSTTISGLSEGIFWNFKEKKIAKSVLNYFEFDESILPEIKPTFSTFGEVSKEAALQTGLASGIPLTYRAGDQPNNAVALNVLRQGEVAATSGTSGVVYGIIDKPLYDKASRVNAFAHVNYEENLDRIGMLLCINGAGIQYSWLKHQLTRRGTTYQDMDRMAASVPVGSEGICILPFGNGAERIFENRNLGAHFVNLRFNRHTRAHLYRASLEGVAFAFVHGINILKEMGLQVDVIRVANDNMFQSKIFSMTIATLLGNHIEVVETTGAIGAAKAAGVAAGVYKSLEEALEGTAPSKLFEPTLNYALCSQAYSYWKASLNKTLSPAPTKASNLELLKNQKTNLEQRLREKSKTIAAQSFELTAGRNTLTSVYDSLNDLIKSKEKPEVLTDRLSKLKHQLAKHLHNETNNVDIEEHFDLLNDHFIKALKTQFPELSFEELKLSALIRLKLSTKQIASKMNLSVRGVESKRYRLRKKINLPKGQNLISFLELIS